MDRDFIVSDVQRMAATNSGKPLGRERFVAATGIGDRDWGKHWIRWGDLITEAGLASNQMQTERPDDEILHCLALFVRDLGRFPVNAELRMRARTVNGFPSHNTFDRFGNRSAKIKRLAAYCETRPELTDVQTICEALATEESRPSPPLPKFAVVDGFVYLFKSGPFHKIGRLRPSWPTGVRGGPTPAL